MKIVVLGAGAWGTAVAMSAAQHPAGHQVTLWARNPAQASAMQTQHENTHYLPGMALPPALQVASGDPVTACHGADLVIVATPMAALRGMLTALQGLSMPVAWLCKGFESPTGAQAADAGLLAHEVCAQVAPTLRSGVLSGPSFAAEVARQQPTALVAASAHEGVSELLVSAFHGEAMRVYANHDIVGVEVGGAVKNVLAIATGVCDGLGLGLNSRAALMTRGLAEIARLGLALGAERQTFMGLAGMGDLILTCTGDLSRNRRVGLALAQNKSLPQILEELGHVAEGVYTAREVDQLSRKLAVDMPISAAVAAVLDSRLTAAQALEQLMSRDPREEIA